MKILIDKKEYSYYLEDDILVLKYNTSHVNFDLALKILDDKFSFLNNAKYLTLIDVSNVKFFDSKAKQLLASKRGIEGVEKCAIHTSSILEKVMVNFFLLIEKPQVETKLFSNYESAIEWLKHNNF
jgi:hypothetical protein